MLNRTKTILLFLSLKVLDLIASGEEVMIGNPFTKSYFIRGALTTLFTKWAKNYKDRSVENLNIFLVFKGNQALCLKDKDLEIAAGAFELYIIGSTDNKALDLRNLSRDEGKYYIKYSFDSKATRFEGFLAEDKKRVAKKLEDIRIPIELEVKENELVHFENEKTEKKLVSIEFFISFKGVKGDKNLDFTDAEVIVAIFKSKDIELLLRDHCFEENDNIVKGLERLKKGGGGKGVKGKGGLTWKTLCMVGGAIFFGILLVLGLYFLLWKKKKKTKTRLRNPK